MNNDNADSIFGDLVQGLEDELNSKKLERQGAYAIASARVTGAVYTDAVASGVPADLAKEMATDVWMAIMGIPHPQIAVLQDGGGDES